MVPVKTADEKPRREKGFKDRLNQIQKEKKKEQESKKARNTRTERIQILVIQSGQLK